MKKKIFAIISIICIISMFCISSYASAIVDGYTTGETPTIETFNPKITFISRYKRELPTELNITYYNFDTAYSYDFPHAVLANEMEENQDYDTDGILNVYADPNNNDTWKPEIMKIASQTGFTLEEYETISSVMYGTYEIEHKQREIDHFPLQNETTICTGRNIIIEDFYVWGLDTFNFSSRTRSEINITMNKAQDKIVRAEIVYRSIYDDNIYHQTIEADPNNEYFNGSYIKPNFEMLEHQDETGMMYVERMVLTLTLPFDQIDPTDTEFDITCDLTGSARIDNYIFNYLNPDDENPAYDLLPFGRTLATAVAGFFSMEIFAGFTLGGIFMTTLAFICVVWWLKLIAGG